MSVIFGELPMLSGVDEAHRILCIGRRQFYQAPAKRELDPRRRSRQIPRREEVGE